MRKPTPNTKPKNPASRDPDRRLLTLSGNVWDVKSAHNSAWTRLKAKDREGIGVCEGGYKRGKRGPRTRGFSFKIGSRTTNRVSGLVRLCSLVPGQSRR